MKRTTSQRQAIVKSQFNKLPEKQQANMGPRTKAIAGPARPKPPRIMKGKI